MQFDCKVPILFAGTHFRKRKTWLPAASTKIPGLLISYQFGGMNGRKALEDRREFRVGTVDGYHAHSFRRLYAAQEFIEQCLEIGLKDFRPPRRGMLARLKKHKEHPTVKRYFTMYAL